MGKYNSHADAQFACSEFIRNLAGPIRHSVFVDGPFFELVEQTEHAF